MTAFRIRDSTLFVTGANRGLGLAFTREALARGADDVSHSVHAALTAQPPVYLQATTA